MSFVVNSGEAKSALWNAWPNLVMTTNSTITYFADTIATEQLFKAQICTKSFFGWGFAPECPRPHWESLQRSPDHLSGWGGRNSRGRDGKGKEGEEDCLYQWRGMEGPSVRESERVNAYLAVGGLVILTLIIYMYLFISRCMITTSEATTDALLYDLSAFLFLLLQFPTPHWLFSLEKEIKRG